MEIARVAYMVVAPHMYRPTLFYVSSSMHAYECMHACMHVAYLISHSHRLHMILTYQGRVQDFLKGGGFLLRSTSKKRKKGGGGQEGSNFRPNVKKPTTWAKQGGPDPLPPRIRPLII